jgi:hypothetical protein
MEFSIPVLQRKPGAARGPPLVKLAPACVRDAGRARPARKDGWRKCAPDGKLREAAAQLFDSSKLWTGDADGISNRHVHWTAKSTRFTMTILYLPRQRGVWWLGADDGLFCMSASRCSA